MEKISHKTRISSDFERCVSLEHFMITPEEATPPKGVDMLITTKYGKTLIGKWDDDCVEWFPLPRRNKYRRFNEI